MAPSDFVLYCLGLSTVVLSSAGCVRLVVGPFLNDKHRTGPSVDSKNAHATNASDPGSELMHRLEVLQATRYASPLSERRAVRLAQTQGQEVRNAPPPYRRPAIRPSKPPPVPTMNSSSQGGDVSQKKG